VDNLDAFEDYCVRIETPGFVPTFAARIELGWFFWEQLGASLFFRWQPDAGTGSLAAFLFGLRLHYLLTDPTPEGVNAHVHLGTSVGQIQPKPPQNGPVEPYIRSGLNGINAGGTVGYRFMRNVGVFLTADFNFLLPVFIFDLDVTGGLEIAF
jgi:hypothetical protein